MEPFLRVAVSNAYERLIARPDVPSTKRSGGETAFVAVVAISWPTGLVPIFAVENESGYELRRLPARGTEGSADPLFFALPREDEPEATNIAGAWSGAATNAQGSKYFPEWELAVADDRVAGRFSPNGEFRVAYITGGSFRSNRLDLYAEYIQDRYTLSGELQGGELSGKWRQHDGSDGGTWSAARAEQGSMPSANNTVELYEWSQGKLKRYAISQPPGSGWTRSAKPLCRVWKP